MSKRRKILIVAAGFFLLCFVGWPTANALLTRHRVSAALREADSARLEEFAYHQTLASVELPRSEWPRIIAAMPVVPDLGIPGNIKLCFIPHHRIVITDRQHQQFELAVCFACDQFHTKATGIVATPYLWYGPLRHLFTSHQIAIRSDREYRINFNRQNPASLITPSPTPAGSADETPRR